MWEIPFSSSHPLLPSSTSAPSCNHCRNISGRANSAAPWRHENPGFFFVTTSWKFICESCPPIFCWRSHFFQTNNHYNQYILYRSNSSLFYLHQLVRNKIMFYMSKIKRIQSNTHEIHPLLSPIITKQKKQFKTKTRFNTKKIHSPSSTTFLSPLQQKLHTTPSTFIEIWLPRYVAWSVFHQPSVGPPHNFHALEPLRHLRLYHHASPSFWMGILVCIVIDSRVIIYSMIDICLQQILLYLPLPYLLHGLYSLSHLLLHTIDGQCNNILKNSRESPQA